MKKALVLTVVVLTALVFAFGCAENAPTDPQTAPTPTPVILAGTFTLSDFDSNTTTVIIGNTSARWISGTDASKGGTSVVNSMMPAMTPAAQTPLHSLSLDAVINSTLDITSGSGDLTAQAPIADKMGYVFASMVFNDAVSLTSNAMGGLSWYHSAVNNSGLSCKVYLYDAQGRFVFKSMGYVNNTWQGFGTCFNEFSVPTGAEYTLEDVLSSLKTITWYYRIFTFGTSSLSTTISIDSVRTFDICI